MPSLLPLHPPDRTGGDAERGHPDGLALPTGGRGGLHTTEGDCEAGGLAHGNAVALLSETEILTGLLDTLRAGNVTSGE